MSTKKRHTPCPVCGKRLAAEIIRRDGDVYLLRKCDEHGTFETPFFRDGDLFDRLESTASADRIRFEAPTRDWAPFSPFVTTIAIDVTTQCNLFCPDCFSRSLPDDGQQDVLTIEAIRDLLPDIPRGAYRPNVSLVGGESVLREDLPDIVRIVHEKGFTARLNSNGIRLLDDDLLKTLKEVDLRWVILQFDGFSPETSVTFRGQDLVDHKLAVVEKLQEYGINVHLAVMIDRGVNLDEIHRILEYAAQTPNILRASFFPRSKVGRNLRPSKSQTHLADLFRAVELQSGGRLTQKDVLAQRRMWNSLFRITHSPLFRTRICITPLVLLPAGSTYVPLNRLASPSTLLRFPGKLRILLDLPHVVRFDRGHFGKKFLLVNFEKFYDTESFLYEDALNCHHIYLTREGYVPFCWHNSFGRKGGC